MLKIWGRANSSNVEKVLWCCDELRLAYERIDAGGQFGRTDEPAYLAMNPNGLVPTIDDDGFILWESNAILRYLGNKHGRLYPVPVRDRAEVDKWLDWQLITLWPPLMPAFFQLVRTPPAQRDQSIIDKSAQQVGTLMGILDQRLAGRAFVAGDEFTIADIANGIVAYRWSVLDIDRPALAHIEAWLAGLARRQPYIKHVAHPLS